MLLGDWSHSVVFDNSRITSLVPGWVERTRPYRVGVAVLNLSLASS